MYICTSFVCSTLRVSSIRIFILIPIPIFNSIDDLKTVDGMRKIHSVRNTGTKGVLEERMFTCCCEKCMCNVLSPIILMNANLSVYWVRGISNHLSNLAQWGQYKNGATLRPGQFVVKIRFVI